MNFCTQTTPVTLNSFQGPFRRQRSFFRPRAGGAARSCELQGLAVRWVLKQVQDDDAEEGHVQS